MIKNIGMSAPQPQKPITGWQNPYLMQREPYLQHNAMSCRERDRIILQSRAAVCRNSAALQHQQDCELEVPEQRGSPCPDRHVAELSLSTCTSCEPGLKYHDTDIISVMRCWWDLVSGASLGCWSGFVGSPDRSSGWSCTPVAEDRTVARSRGTDSSWGRVCCRSVADCWTSKQSCYKAAAAVAADCCCSLLCSYLVLRRSDSECCFAWLHFVVVPQSALLELVGSAEYCSKRDSDLLGCR